MSAGHDGVTGPDAPVDVVVVGFGPVGQVLAVLLAQQGWRTTVVERQREAYPLPRAVSYDGHAARLLESTGIGPSPADEGMPSPDYAIVDAQGRSLLHVPLQPNGRHGRPDATSVHQPSLERRLQQRAAALPSLEVRRGVQAVHVRELDCEVVVGLEDAAGGDAGSVRSRWVVGCDGAGSLLRRTIGAQLVDAGFSCDWLACDVLPHDGELFPPTNLQIADERRPRVAVTAGPRVRRYEFMRVQGEPPAVFAGPERAWELLGLFGVTADRAQLLRRATYRVRAVNADRWRSGRVFLAGDAAHQMPPFIGQGMCSGVRDAANLAWKLDLVLRGVADHHLLATYEAERRPDVQAAIDLSVQLGRLICGAPSGPVPTSERPAASTSPDGQRPPSLPGPLRHGLLGRIGERLRTGAGVLSPQGRVRATGEPQLLDRLVGPRLLLLTSVAREEVVPGATTLLRRLGVHVLQVVAVDGPAGTAAVADEDDVYLPWLRSLGAVAVLVRPDAYVFAAAGVAGELAAVLDDLAGQLGLAEESEVAVPEGAAARR